MSIQLAHQRILRSYVRREGRMTPGQQRALAHLWSRYGVSASEPLSAQCDAGSQALVLEIGFGMGQSLLQMAAANPHEYYLGVEVYRPGVGALLAELDKQAIENIKVYQEDAALVCSQCIAQKSLHRIQIFFPDPWPKKKHHKRRLVQKPFIDMLASRLTSGGLLHLATDVASYAEHMQAVMAAQPSFGPGPALDQLSYQRPMTKFEKAGLAKGHGIYDLVYQRLEA
jgi:tRNA (guanine-N7-)-methyltransferase